MNMNIPQKIVNKYFIGIDSLKQKREKYITRYNGSNSNILCGTFDKQSDKMLIYENEIERLIPHEFEDITVLIPAGYDSILTRTYGNYMEYPPVELQFPHHHFIPYWSTF